MENKDKHECKCVKVNGVECTECKCSDKKSKESKDILENTEEKGIEEECRFCSYEFEDIENFRKGSYHEDIFYNSKNGKHILVLEQFRYEYSTLEINYCPKCGRKL